MYAEPVDEKETTCIAPVAECTIHGAKKPQVKDHLRVIMAMTEQMDKKVLEPAQLVQASLECVDFVIDADVRRRLTNM